MGKNIEGDCCMNEQKELKDILRTEGLMSKGFGIIPKIVMQDTRLSRDAKCMYSYFRSFAGAGDTAFPGISKICQDLNYGSEKTCVKHRRELEKYGYIIVEQERNEQGKFARNIYVLCENPEILAFQPTGNLAGTVKYRHGEKPSRSNRGSNINSIYKNNSINKNNNNVETESCCCDALHSISKNEPEQEPGTDEQEKYIREIAKEYHIECRFWKKEVFGVLLRYAEWQVRQIFKTLQEKHQKGTIKNPSGLLAKDTLKICEAILNNQLYPDIPEYKAKSKQQYESFFAGD
jgi:hypothetical protein